MRTEEFSQKTVRSSISMLIIMLFVFQTGVGVAEYQWTYGGIAEVGEIVSETFATWPADTGRNMIGGGEEVTCRIDPTTWSDFDRLLVRECPDDNWTNLGLFADAIGTIQWIGMGDGGSIPYQSYGLSVVMTAKRVIGSYTVYANVFDSQTQYTDYAVQKMKGYSIRLPISPTVTWKSDTTTNYPGTSGTDKFGAGSYFELQFGTTMNFSRLSIRENCAAVAHVWPNGLPWNNPQEYVNAPIGDNNVVLDRCDDGGPRPKQYLNVDDDPNGPFVMSSLARNVAFEYQADDGYWYDMNNVVVNHTWVWYVNLTARTWNQNVPGRLQGPWQ
ncbi:hypothetical protein HQ520_12390 [bacterium]|nr:hypothetical protein [bacterium]